MTDAPPTAWRLLLIRLTAAMLDADLPTPVGFGRSVNYPDMAEINCANESDAFAWERWAAGVGTSPRRSWLADNGAYSNASFLYEGWRLSVSSYDPNGRQPTVELSAEDAAAAERIKVAAVAS